MTKYNFIIVSNRLPVNVGKRDGKLTFSKSSGGLATAMSSLSSGSGNHIWVGWPGISADDLTPAEKAAITKKLTKQGFCPVFLTSEQIKTYYDGYANDTIWPLFHYFQSYARFDDAYWAGYASVNRLFAKTVARIAQSDAVIWVHDYHLMLLPKLLRTHMPEASIGFYMHIPFPSFEIFRTLPNREALLKGMLGADLVGFHTYDYAQHFMGSARRTLGLQVESGSVLLDEHKTIVDAFPIGIDYQKFATAPSQHKVKQEISALDERYHKEKIILSIDRLDYTKGIINRLHAFEHFLHKHPQYHKKVCLIVVAVPSRTEVQAYQALRDTIEQTLSRINGKYATVDWTPILYQFKNLPFEQVTALYAKAHIALVTPLRDGMNLVAKEYVASKPGAAGVLILSELAGAADELHEAIRINPNDKGAISAALRQALTMPRREQRRRMLAMQRWLSRYTVQRWANDFIRQLTASREVRAKRQSKLFTRGAETNMHETFAKAKHRMLLLDYDGTLKPFVNTPDPKAAAPSKALKTILQNLAQLPETQVCIISGRTKTALENWFGRMPLTLVAEHGAWTKQNGTWQREPLTMDEHKAVLRPVLEHYIERTPGAKLEEKDVALVWHYRNVPPELAYARNLSLRHELGNLLAGTDIGMFSGNKIIEIKPKSIQKGNIVRRLLGDSPPEFILCAGDDYTDEDMFQVLPAHAFGIKIGPQDTHARFQLTSLDTLRNILKRLTQQL